jgi:alpha-ketoglutarate-dependent taurine dioxygenase
MNQIKVFSYNAAELKIVWRDTSESQLQAIWLRDHCQMPASRNPDNGQRLLNITDIPEDIAIEKVSLEDRRLLVQFAPDGHRSEFDLDWLYNNCYNLNRSIDTLTLPPEIMRQFYAAYRHYAEILERKKQQIVFDLQPGELILFDSTRILHAHKTYSAGGTRHLQGAYSDLDGLYSSLRKLEANS